MFRLKRQSRMTSATAILLHRLKLCFYAMSAVFVLGTLGYCLIEGWSLQDSFFMTSITMSTVGFGEVQPLSPIGRLFTSLLILLSLVGVSCSTACLTTALVSREISGSLVSSRIRKMARALKGHTIIFGHTIMTEEIASQLLQEGREVLLVEEHHEKVLDLRTRYPELLVMEATPKDESVLFDANLMAAHCVIAGLETDFENLLIAMTVKEITPHVKVIARANDPKVASRMHKIGVDQVVCPYQLSGRYVANLLLTEDLNGQPEDVSIPIPSIN